jgi:hypothetical protein
VAAYILTPSADIAAPPHQLDTPLAIVLFDVQETPLLEERYAFELVDVSKIIFDPFDDIAPPHQFEDPAEESAVHVDPLLDDTYGVPVYIGMSINVPSYDIIKGEGELTVPNDVIFVHDAP